MYLVNFDCANLVEFYDKNGWDPDSNSPNSTEICLPLEEDETATNRQNTCPIPLPCHHHHQAQARAMTDVFLYYIGSNQLMGTSHANACPSPCPNGIWDFSSWAGNGNEAWRQQGGGSRLNICHTKRRTGTCECGTTTQYQAFSEPRYATLVPHQLTTRGPSTSNTVKSGMWLVGLP